ncbi:MAG: glycoside hydrolase family 95 protein [Armatimonadetes bacterium]|nr:glycoside hydrolase family 95 protein [Armatimonadota bacterium]
MLSTVLAAALIAAPDPWTTLWFDQPVSNRANWVEAFPIGNGRLGAMAFGGVGKEQILLNENTIWERGNPQPQPENSAEVIANARKLAFAGKLREAEQALKPIMTQHQDISYQPAGWLTFTDSDYSPFKLDLTDWFQVKEGQEVPIERPFFNLEPNQTVEFVAKFELTEQQAKGINRIHFSPIDDESVITLNGKEIGRTTDWSKEHDFSIQAQPGANTLHLMVKNVGGVGHGPASVTLSGEPTAQNYRRSLDMQTGISTTTFEQNGFQYGQEVFASQPAQVIVIRKWTNNPDGLNFRVGYESELAEFKWESGALVAQTKPDRQGTQYRTVVQPNAANGAPAPNHFRGMREVVFFVTIETDYRTSRANLDQAQVQTQKAKALGYEKLKQAAIEDHQALYDRCRLKIGTEAEALKKQELPLDQRIANYKAKPDDQALEGMLFEYGRYLLIASSRPGGLPANLQGLWNPHMKAPWNSDYHTNINLQMNYWPAEVTGLGDLHQPLFDWLKMVADGEGKRMAKNLGSNGFAIAHTSDAWGWASTNGQPVWGMWVMGGAWTSNHLMEHYRFTEDKKFLREQAYPLLKSSAEFLLDWLTLDPKSGKLVSGPTTSPENTYIVDGKRIAVSMGPAMDQYIAYENFSNVIEAAKALRIDDDFTQQVWKARAQLKMPEIGSDGRLMEWSEAYQEAEPGHRHMSHVYGLHPSNQITPSDKALYNAIRKSVEYRLSHGGGHTGWSRAWIINIWARLHDGERAHENVQALLQKSIVGALMDNHPPFQIDGNFGYTAGIAEMLIQSHEVDSNGKPIIRIAPAVPKAWQNLEITGLRLRGGGSVDISIKDGKVSHTIHR